MEGDKKTYLKKYREEHKEEIAAKVKAYKLANKERLSAKNKEYREAHKEKISEYQKKYRIENKEKASSYHRQYREDHKEDLSEKEKKRYEHRCQTKKGRADILVASYNARDRKRGFDSSYNITREWIIKNVFSGQECIYCSEKDWKKLGVDRIDNTKPHLPENCVPCCQTCNSSRGNRKSFEEFIKIKKGGA